MPIGLPIGTDERLAVDGHQTLLKRDSGRVYASHSSRQPALDITRFTMDTTGVHQTAVRPGSVDKIHPRILLVILYRAVELYNLTLW